MSKSSGITKGDLRAFIGVKTWINEQESLRSGADLYKSHISGFEEALDLFERLDKNEIERELQKSIKLWNNTYETKTISNGKKEPVCSSPIKSLKKINQGDLKMVSLFSGAMGLDLGFMAAGFDIRFANDISEDSANTIKKNLPNIEFNGEDIQKVTSSEISRRAGLDVGEIDVLVGGPPCQPFSTAGKREGFSDPRASPLVEFIRVINDLQPKFFVMEEVTGLLSARLKHISIKERKTRELLPEEKKGTVFKRVLEMLKDTEYQIEPREVNAANFGSPQKRRRIIILGRKKGKPSFPKKTHSDTYGKLVSGDLLLPWNSLWEATVDLQGKEQEYSKLSKSQLEYMKQVIPAGYWKHLPEDIVEEAMGGAYTSGGGKMGYFRRLSWEEPSPTVVTSPSQKSTMLCHPYENRPLSVEEYKRIQGFPDDWEIVGNTRAKYKLIGDAVPVHLSYSIAKEVYKQIISQK